MQRLKQSVAPIRLRAALRKIKLENQRKGEYSNMITVPLERVTDPIPACSRDKFIHVASLSPEVNWMIDPCQYSIILNATKKALVGHILRYRDQDYVVLEVFTSNNGYFFMARIRPTE
jgi:hypothetical protein